MSAEDNKLVAGASSADEASENPEIVEKNAETDSGEGQDQPKERPKKDGTQRRIDQLTRKNYALRGELSEMRQELHELRILSRRGDGLNDAQQDRADSLDHQVRQMAEELLRAEKQQEWQRAIWEKSSEIMDIACDLGDFDIEEFRDTTKMSQAMADALAEAEDTEVAAKIAVFFYENPSEVRRIAKLSERRQAAEIGKLEDRFTREQQKPKPAAKKSAAPEPIKPVNAGKSPAGFRVGMSQAEYRAWRASNSSR